MGRPPSAPPSPQPGRAARHRLRVAVVGSGIAGLGCAWLLSRGHDVTVYESDEHLGGHANTVTVPTPEGPVAVDTGFIVFNEPCYPNFTALLRHLQVATVATDMSFGVSLDRGRMEYAGSSRLGTLFAQKRNLLRPRFWRMLRDLVRFYRAAPALLHDPAAESLTLGEVLARGGYGDAFITDHLLPMGSAIWSAAADDMRRHPARAFVRFCDNHGLLRLRDRPVWRTVKGGSREYVARLTAPFADAVLPGRAVRRIHRVEDGVLVTDEEGMTALFDHVVLACHADQALGLLGDAGASERAVLGAFRTQPNEAWLHTDPDLMPRRRNAWASWNYLSEKGRDGRAAVCVTYWMNRLQALPTATDLFVTLNPDRPPQPEAVLRRIRYSHPLFDMDTERAQRLVWQRLQGRRNTWFCGAWMGAGFHEDGLQAGLLVAERLGGVRRPWQVDDENGRLPLSGAPGRLPEVPA